MFYNEVYIIHHDWIKFINGIITNIKGDNK